MSRVAFWQDRILLMDTMKLTYSDEDGVHSFELSRDVIAIGRAPDQDLVLKDSRVSRRHAVIMRVGDTYRVVDQKSTHGTFLNGARVEEVVLQPGDQLQFGSVKGPLLKLTDQRTAGTESLSQSRVNDLLTSLIEVRAPANEPRPAARAMEKLNWLLDAARQLNEGGAIEDLLGALLQLTLQLTRLERGFVFLQEDGEMRLARGLNANGDTAGEDRSVSRRAMQKAIESDSNFSITDTLADHDAAEWPSILANSIRGIYCIPLRKRASSKEPNRLLGLLYLDSQIGLSKLTEIDHQLLDTIAVEAATLLHNALLAEAERKARQAREELAVAARIHRDLMSIAVPKLTYAEIGARSIPCLAIGGDFFDVVALEDCVCVTVTDISGKGVSAAIVAATLQGIIHSQFLTGRSLAEIALAVNHFLCTRNTGKYATTILLKLFPDGSVEYANCGHVQPLAILNTRIRRLEESNLVVGLIPGATYVSARCKLEPGERILLTTDGITEAEDPAGNQFGDSGLDDIAPHNGLDAILDHVTKFQAPNEAQDDCTLMEIRYVGSA
jgi:sigma-B regulation protein RsbU (phosphoserine phosphatase)